MQFGKGTTIGNDSGGKDDIEIQNKNYGKNLLGSNYGEKNKFSQMKTVHNSKDEYNHDPILFEEGSNSKIQHY